MKKVLFLIHDLGGGGAEKVLVSLVNNMDSSKFDITVNDNTTAADVDGWDSLRHITLLAAIEDEFDIEFSMGATVKMKNVGEMVDYIEDEV